MPPAKRPAAKRKPAVGGLRDRKCKGLIFGPYKHGKSHLLGTATLDPRTTPIAILDLEGGVLDVLDGLPGGPDGPNWYHIPVRTWEDVNEAYERLVADDPKLWKHGKVPKAAAIDSLSETHIMALMTLLEMPGINRDEKDKDLIQQPDYGKALVQMRRFSQMFRDLPMHVFFTAHSKDEADPRLGLVKMPKLSGQAAMEIPGMMSLVGYLALDEDDDGETRRVLLIQNYAKILTGVRMPWGVEAPDEIYDPTITSILDALKYN